MNSFAAWLIGCQMYQTEHHLLALKTALLPYVYFNIKIRYKPNSARLWALFVVPTTPHFSLSKLDFTWPESLAKLCCASIFLWASVSEFLRFAIRRSCSEQRSAAMSSA